MASMCTSVLDAALCNVKAHPYVATAVVLVATVFYFRKRLFKPQLDRPLVKNPQLNKVYLYQFQRVYDMNCSPFCLKVETFLRMNGIEYEIIADYNNLSKFSRHKLPVIQYNQEIVQDSANILRYLERKVVGKAEEDSMSDKEKATASMVVALVELELSPILVYYRWVHESGWPKWSQNAFGALNPVLKMFVPNLARNNTRRGLISSGVARFPAQELLDKAKVVFETVDTLLKANKYIVNDKFSLADAAVYGVLSNIILCPLDTPLQQLALRYDRLVSYCKNIRDQAESKKFVATSSSSTPKKK